MVSRGGRPDLAGDALESVQAPTLLIVGERDRQVLELHEAAAARFRCEHRLVVVPRATHLFEEPGALEEVAHLAGDWFTAHLAAHGHASPYADRVVTDRRAEGENGDAELELGADVEALVDDDEPVLDETRHYLQDPDHLAENARDADEQEQDEELELDQTELDELGLTLDDPHQPESE